jgi:hypothetical protein
VSYVYSVDGSADPMQQESLRTIGFGGGPSWSATLSTPNAIDFVVSFAVLASGTVAYTIDGEATGLLLTG